MLLFICIIHKFNQHKERGNPLQTIVRILIVSIIFLGIGFYFNVNQKNDNNVLLKKNTTKQTEGMIVQNHQNHPGRAIKEKPDRGLLLLIGEDLPELEKKLGKPNRIDQTIYGYKWYIYNDEYKQYLQVGVENNRVVTIYALGNDLDVSPFEIGQPLEKIFNTQFIDTNIDIKLDGNSYRFELNDTDINLRPLIQIGDFFAQLYFDKITGTLSSVRFLDTETLIKLRPYELEFHGKLITPPIINNIVGEKSQKGTEMEILDITNVLRQRSHVKPLKWDEKIAKAALEHSKDMYKNDGVKLSNKYSSLTDRLKSANIEYQAAGENIAVNYTDSPSVVECWLNSESHRAQLLNKNFTQLGVGVYQDYYTQDFIQKK